MSVLHGSTVIFSLSCGCCEFLNQRQGLGCQWILGEVEQPPAAEDELSTSQAEGASTFCKPWKLGWRLLPFSLGCFSTSKDFHPLTPWVLPSERGFVAMPCAALVDSVVIS